MRKVRFQGSVVLVLVLVLVLVFFDAVAGWSSEIDVYNCEMQKGFYALWELSSFGMEPLRQERAAWIRIGTDLKYEFVQWEITPERERVSWRGRPIPDEVIAQAHTHPNKDDPRPSNPDKLVAKRLNLPIYTISRKGIWRVNPEGVMVQIAGLSWHKTLDVCGR